MSTLSVSYKNKKTSPYALLLAIAVLLLGVISYNICRKPSERIKVEIKSGGKNAKHANPKAKDAAKDKYQEVKGVFEKLETKANKSPEEKKLLEKLRAKMKHWQKKKDWSGEHHSQQQKGN